MLHVAADGVFEQVLLKHVVIPESVQQAVLCLQIVLFQNISCWRVAVCIRVCTVCTHWDADCPVVCVSVCRLPCSLYFCVPIAL